MIIRSLHAESFMKWDLLDLTNLPTGAIAIEGENEAGKTTIGECVAFALFGRTVRTEETDPAQAIHWDSDRSTTAIEFEVQAEGEGNGHAGIYKLERIIERGGTVEARLYAPNGQLLGTNPREVAKALPRVLGFSFPEFRYSFYVAQKELDLVRHATRDNTRRIIYDMLGITAVERARALVARELEEAKERSRTLERDLVVAQALLTEAKGDRETGEAAVRDREAADAEAAQTATAEEHAKSVREAAVAAGDARRDALTSFGRLEGAILAGAQRARLAQARAQLASIAGAAKAHATNAQGAVSKDEKGREGARTLLERARGAREAARALAAVVDARKAQLKAELAAAEGKTAAGAGLSIGELASREKERAERLAKRRGRRTIFASLLLLLGLLAGGAAFGLRYPPDAPFLKAQWKDQSITLEGQQHLIDARRASYGLGAIGAVALVWSLFAFLGRRSYSLEARASQAELDKLAGATGKLKTDLAALEGFDVKKLKDIDAKARKIEGDEAVAKALSAFNASAKTSDVAQSDLSPDALVDEAQKKLDALEKERALAEPRLNEANRIMKAALRSLELADSSLDERTKQAAGATEDLSSLDLAALDQRLDQASSAAARARVELEALQAAGQDGTVPEAARSLQESLGKVFEARPEARGAFEQQSGLKALLESLKKGPPSPDDLRDALKREREVMKVVLGTEEQVRSLLAQAEEGYRKSRDARARAESKAAEARARGERATIGQTRATELEVKVAGLEGALHPLMKEVQVHEECLRLQDDLVKAMKTRFGPGISRYIEVILPRLTGGRYRKVKIDEDLDLRVFSNERGDYVRLVDISFGTADQVLLALRLGLARALVASRGLDQKAHFLFLDEPLASADETRGQAFLELLRSFDDQFAQVFVTSTRPLDGNFSKRIKIETSSKTLTV